MSLKEINLKAVYYSDEDKILQDFYIPVLSRSIKYSRIAGYFCSNTLAIAAKGIATFIMNGGEIRLITNIELAQEDQVAIENALLRKEEEILVDINNLEEELKKDHIKMLGWMMRNNKLRIKIAVVHRGIEHKKVGILQDSEGNVLSFSGSDNETIHGWLLNDEQFHVFCSWKEGDKEHLVPEMDKFEQLWDNRVNKVRVYSVSDAFNKGLIKIAPRNSEEFKNISERTTEGLIRESKESWRISQEKTRNNAFWGSLWYFQKEAIDSWKRNNFKGIFSMATGTGKTKAAVGGIIKLREKINNLFVVIVCPQNTIIKQWEQEINSIGVFSQSSVADSTNIGWPKNLADKAIDFNGDRIENCIVYTTYNTLCSNKFIKIISELGGNILLICDEVHWVGANIFQKGLLPIFKYRLGLSATPERYMDEEGSDVIKDYFGKVVYEFSLKRALTEINPETGETFLCPYNYYPVFVELGSVELEGYLKLTEEIKKQYVMEIKLEKKSNYYQRLCEKRQAIITNAEDKYRALRDIIGSLKKAEFLLIYCSPQQIDKAQDMLNSGSIKNHRFTGEEGTGPREEYNDVSERDFIIANFENGNYSALVAMKCLDEGINVLRAETGILMASSGNSKQYIQRRGRLLRRHKDKPIVNIYDILVVPYLDTKRASGASAEELRILEKEFKRYEEFAGIANNRLEARNRIFKIKDMYQFFKKEDKDESSERNKSKNFE